MNEDGIPTMLSARPKDGATTTAKKPTVAEWIEGQKAKATEKAPKSAIGPVTIYAIAKNPKQFGGGFIEFREVREGGKRVSREQTGTIYKTAEEAEQAILKKNVAEANRLKKLKN